VAKSPPLTRIKRPMVANPVGFVRAFRHHPSVFLSRTLYRRLASVLTACMLFAQTAGLAYACSWEREAAATQPVAATCSEHRSGANATEAEHPVPQGNACEVHCLTASLPDLGAGDVPATPAVAVWDIQPFVVPRARSAPAAELEAKSAAPPLRTLFARMLI